MGQQLTEMAANISGLSRRAQTMNEVLKNVTSELKQQRKDAFSDVGKLEMKYLEQCALLPLQVTSSNTAADMMIVFNIPYSPFPL